MPTKNPTSETVSPSFVGNLIHEIKETLRTEPHSIEEVKELLAQARTADLDFIHLLERHHDYLQESIGVLMNSQAQGFDKQFHLQRFLQLLTMHARAEQEVLYINLMHNRAQEARLEGLSGQDEHDIASHLAEELQAMRPSIAWTEEIDAKAKVIAILVANHIKEEESHMFPIARRDIPTQDMKNMCADYIRRCRIHLDMATARKPKSILMT